MISGPRTSWKTSSKRRSRPSGTGSLNAGEIKQNAAKKQLNPYKSSLRDSHNSHKSPHGNSATRGVTDDQDNFRNSDIDLGASDEEFGIDDILKDIDDDDDGKNQSKSPAASASTKTKSDSESNKHQITDKQTTDKEVSKNQVSPIADYMPKRMVKNADMKLTGRKAASAVDFGERKQGRDRARIEREIPRHRKTRNRELEDVNTTTEEDNDTLLNDSFSDGDATKEHKMLVQTGQTPIFSSGGFDGDNKSRRRSSSNLSLDRSSSNPSQAEMQDTMRKSNNLVDDLLDDFGNGYNNLSFDKKSDGTISTGTPDSADRSLRNLVNDYASSTDKKSRPQPKEKVASPPDPYETNESGSAARGTKRIPATAVRKASIQEDETLSAVTDPTESPFIYTYKKDDDEVSQITSSLAGHSMGSVQLQNVSNNTGSNSAQNRNDITWMSGTGGAGNRMAYRKPAGLYGRNRGRKSAKLPKTTGGSSSGSVGSSSFDGGGGNSALDEIAYALNAETTGRSQRARRPQGRGSASTLLEEGRGDDLSTIASQSTGYISKPYSIDVKSNVSGLGMSGVSCSETVAGASVSSESSTSTFAALFSSLSTFLFKAQHHAGRFFFPTSAAVTRRKKFDRSDSLEDILLEEGSKTPSTMKRTGRISFDEDEIDYFSRAMGNSSSSQSYNSSPNRPKRKKSVWQRTTVRVGGAFLFMTFAITIYKMPSNDKSSSERFYDPSRNGQVFDHATNALIDTSDVPKSRDVLAELRQNPAEAILENIPRLPSQFQALANVDSGPFQRGIDVPFYWHVPRSGGGTVNDILGSCLHLTLAADAGGSEGESGVEMLKVLHFSHEVNYLNVDTSTLKGIQRAQDLNLVPSGLADVVISPLLHDATTLFTPTRKGRLFAILRDPVERAASLFYFIQDTQWKQPNSGNEQFASMTIDEFYEGGFAENNWMTRFLTNELTKGELTEEDLNIAKEVLRQKCLIGLLDSKGETFDRFQKYFGWRPKNGAEEECLAKKLEWAWPMKHRHPSVETGSGAYGLIVAQNTFDLQLYKYATELFKQQEQLFP